MKIDEPPTDEQQSLREGAGATSEVSDQVIDVVESPSIVLEGPPLTGRCPSCDADLDELKRHGKIGHACFGPGDRIDSDPPS